MSKIDKKIKKIIEHKSKLNKEKRKKLSEKISKSTKKMLRRRNRNNLKSIILLYMCIINDIDPKMYIKKSKKDLCFKIKSHKKFIKKSTINYSRRYNPNSKEFKIVFYTTVMSYMLKYSESIIKKRCGSKHKKSLAFRKEMVEIFKRFTIETLENKYTTDTLLEIDRLLNYENNLSDHYCKKIRKKINKVISEGQINGRRGGSDPSTIYDLLALVKFINTGEERLDNIKKKDLPYLKIDKDLRKKVTKNLRKSNNNIMYKYFMYSTMWDSCCTSKNLNTIMGLQFTKFIIQNKKCQKNIDTLIDMLSFSS